MSDDDKHKLYQAAGMTGDAEVVRRVSVKIGLMNEDYTPGANYEKFVQAAHRLGDAQHRLHSIGKHAGESARLRQRAFPE